MAIDDGADEPVSGGKKVLKLLKTLLIAASVAMVKKRMSRDHNRPRASPKPMMATSGTAPR